MKKVSLVSVIVPLYNAEQFLSKTIESILDQTYQEIELILINDGSTDSSEEICLSYQNRDSRIIYRKQLNQGPSATRNHGLNLAKGEYIAFVDADDHLEKNGIEVLLESIQQADIVISGYKNVYEEDSEEQKIKETIPAISGLFSKEEFVAHFGSLLEKNLIHYVWHKLYRAEIIKSVRFNEMVNIGEDMLFNIEILKRAKNISITKKSVYSHIWYNNQSITSGYKERLFLMRKHQYLVLKSFLKESDSYTGKNKQVVDQLFIKRITDCFINLESKQSSLNKKEKKKEVAEIIQDDIVRNIYPLFKRAELWQRPYMYLIKGENVSLILLYTRLLLPLQTWRRKKVKV